MPLPLIPIVLGGVAAAGTAIGAYKGGKAIKDNSKAKKLNAEANDIIEDAKSSLSCARTKSKKALEDLGNKKLAVCQTSVKSFVELFEQIKNVELQESVGLQELSKFRIDKQAIADFRKISILATSFAAGVLSGTIAGGAVAFGAYSSAGVLATASTGTAIASLHGIAATNATLAWFGGGSLAVGGWGMAAGTWVLGGLVAGPALAVVGVVMGAKASKNLDCAYSNVAKAREVREEINVLVTACNGIAKRAALFNKILIKLDLMFVRTLNLLNYVIQAEGKNFAEYSPSAKRTVAKAVSTAQAVKAILDTPLLDDTGKLTDESAKVAKLICEKCQIEA